MFQPPPTYPQIGTSYSANRCSKTFKTGIIESIKAEDGKVKVFCVQEAEFDFDDGDMVKFDEVQGLTGLTQHKIAKVSKGRKCFEVPDVTVSGAWTKGGILNEVKQEKEFNFKPLKDILVNPGLMIDIDQSIISVMKQNYKKIKIIII